MDDLYNFHLSFENITVELTMPTVSTPNTIVYIHGSGEETVGLYEMLCEPKPVLAAISGIDWNRDLSPWQAEKVFKNDDDFSGGADAHLLNLLNNIIPAVEKKTELKYKHRVIAGYSLAGLFAVYSLFKTDVFDRAASMSGSLWFDGFSQYMESHSPIAVPEKIFFSLGDREKLTKNQRMCYVEDCTEAACNYFAKLGADSSFVLNSGGHFNDIRKRIAKGIDSVIR